MQGVAACPSRAHHQIDGSHGVAGARGVAGNFDFTSRGRPNLQTSSDRRTPTTGGVSGSLNPWACRNHGVNTSHFYPPARCDTSVSRPGARCVKGNGVAPQRRRSASRPPGTIQTPLVGLIPMPHNAAPISSAGAVPGPPHLRQWHGPSATTEDPSTTPGRWRGLGVAGDMPPPKMDGRTHPLQRRTVIATGAAAKRSSPRATMTVHPTLAVLALPQAVGLAEPMGPIAPPLAPPMRSPRPRQPPKESEPRGWNPTSRQGTWRRSQWLFLSLVLRCSVRASRTA